MNSKPLSPPETLSFEDAQRVITAANLVSYRPQEVDDEYVCGKHDILISGTRKQCEDGLIQVKAMIASGKIQTADLTNVRLKISGAEVLPWKM